MNLSKILHAFAASAHENLRLARGLALLHNGHIGSETQVVLPVVQYTTYTHQGLFKWE